MTKNSSSHGCPISGIGEIVGGSQREERYEVLKGKMDAMGIPEEELYWYLDLRKLEPVCIADLD